MLIPILILASLRLGAVDISFKDLIEIIKNVVTGTESGQSQSKLIILFIRLPRIIGAILVGASLSAAGASLQGLFRNPMASPEILGISAGGSLGAVLVINTGLIASGIAFLPISTSLFALITAFLIYRIATYRGKTSLLFLVLTGLALSSLMNGLVSLVLLFSREYEVNQFFLWTMGSLDSIQWHHVRITAPILIPGMLFLFLLSGELNILMFGEKSAHSLGMRVERTKRIILMLSAILTGIAVSIAGTIGFVGLLVPHAVRFFTRGDNRMVVPLSAVVGGEFLLLCDTIGRFILAPFEIKVGIITALIGAPYFLFLILRYQKKGQDGIFI